MSFGLIIGLAMVTFTLAFISIKIEDSSQLKKLFFAMTLFFISMVLFISQQIATADGYIPTANVLGKAFGAMIWVTVIMIAMMAIDFLITVMKPLFKFSNEGD